MALANWLVIYFQMIFILSNRSMCEVHLNKSMLKLYGFISNLIIIDLHSQDIASIDSKKSI